MKFWLMANCLFEADDVDDAMLKLSDHFRNVYLRKNESLFLPHSCIQVGKIIEETE